MHLLLLDHASRCIQSEEVFFHTEDRCFQLEGESALDTVSENFEKMRLDQFRQIIETCDWVDGLSKHLLQQLSDASHPMSVRVLDALRLGLFRT